MIMKSLKQAKSHLLFLSCRSKFFTISPLLQQQSFISTSSSEKLNTTDSRLTLTNEELTKINLLIPRLCLLNHLITAIRLTTTVLLTNPPLKSISLSILIHSLTSQPDMTKLMSLLTILRHTPQAHSHLTRITTMLITSYVKKKRPKEAFKIYRWMLRPGSPCKVEKIVFLALVNAFCEFGSIIEGLRILRDMVYLGYVPGDGLRRTVCRSLLMEARVREAVELDKALRFYANGDVDSADKVKEMLDSMIENWTE